MTAISERLNPNRVPREPFGLKAESSLNRITLNPSSANPGETLYVNIPQLSDNVVIIPGSVSLLFNLTVGGHANNTLVNNVGRNLVSNLKVTFGGETLHDTQRYDLFKTYEDLFLQGEEREDRLRQGISSVNMRKLRTGAGDKDTSDAGELAMSVIHNTKYRIPLDHSILNDHGVLCTRRLSHPLIFEIKLAKVADIVTYSDTVKTPNYRLTNLELEYQCMSSQYLADEASSAYQVGKGFYYENVINHKTFTISKSDDSVINEHINLPRRSMTGVLCLFTENHTAGTRDSEKFVNPDIESVHINIDGMPNKLYSMGMLPSDFWTSLGKRFNLKDSSIKQKDFYTSDKFALWIDLRTYPDNTIHGGGLRLNTTRDGVKLEIRRKASGSGFITCHMFIVADAIMEVMHSSLKSITY